MKTVALKTPSVYIGTFFVVSRDAVARGLSRLGISPNVLTVLGMLITCLAAVFLALGPQHWLTAGFLMMGSGACDMLDGAVARLGRRTRFGGVLDSTCDRISDVVLMAGLCAYYLLVWPAQNNAPANLTYGLLAVMAIINATLISYIRARAKHEMEDCNVGFWQRGERHAAVIIGSFAGHPAVILWELGAWAALTALQRLLATRRVLLGQPATDERPGLGGGLKRLVFFNSPRLTLSYDLYTGTAIAFLIFLNPRETDIVRMALNYFGALYAGA